MAKKVLIISTSIRPNSNSEMLANAFADGDGTSGNEVEIPALIGISAIQRLALMRRGT